MRRLIVLLSVFGAVLMAQRPAHAFDVQEDGLLLEVKGGATAEPEGEDAWTPKAHASLMIGYGYSYGPVPVVYAGVEAAGQSFDDQGRSPLYVFLVGGGALPFSLSDSFDLFVPLTIGIGPNFYGDNEMGSVAVKANLGFGAAHESGLVVSLQGSGLGHFERDRENQVMGLLSVGFFGRRSNK